MVDNRIAPEPPSVGGFIPLQDADHGTAVVIVGDDSPRPQPSSSGPSAAARSSSASPRKVQHQAEKGSADNAAAVSSQMQIVYVDLKYTVKVKEKKGGWVSKDLLRGLSGVVQPGRTTAVMGASGAGKTTFLNVLAGYQKGNASVAGSISVNGERVDGAKMRRISGFVHQEDVILDTMTVREALLFSARLKLPRAMPLAAKQQRALDVADLLNLTRSLDNVVGSALIKGISGGEKRRLSLGMEMITNPSILYLDEPTSGLDTYTAYKVAKILSVVAQKHGRTILCTIHQPSSDIFHTFDNLIVLAQGQLMYHGEVEGMVPYFARLAYVCPTYTNPADFLFMDVLNSDVKGEGSPDDWDFMKPGTSGALTTAPSEPDLERGAPSETRAAGGDAALSPAQRLAKEREDARIRELLEAWGASQEGVEMDRLIRSPGEGASSPLMGHGIDVSAVSSSAAFLDQFSLLAKRAAYNMWRNKLMLRSKFGQTVFLSLIVGLIYLRISDSLTGVQDRQGSLFFLAVQGFFSSVMGVVTVFGGEKAVFTREFGSRMYGLPAYFLSRWVVDLPTHIIAPILSSVILYWMVGYQDTVEKFWNFTLTLILMDNTGAAIGIFVSCLFSDISVALTVMPLFMMPLMVFSGFFVNSDNIPKYFIWISYISPMRYGFQALAINEFSGLEIHCTPDQDCSPGFNGDKVLETLGFQGMSCGENMAILLAVTFGFLLLAYVALWVTVRRVR